MLIDCRHDPQPIDMEFMNWLGSNGIPFSMVFTKADKLKPKALQEQVQSYLDRMLQDWEELPPYFITSSSKRTGRDELLGYIEDINQEVNAH